ncbi:MAG TPA: c-type cytochrome [Terracidiphilus sp.]|jgi:mono/diheme cytochrome c family protein
MRRIALPLALLAVSACGCKANHPGKAESGTMWGLKHHVMVGNKKEKNPLPQTAETVADGKEAFSHYCAACHGLDGQNTGVPFADRMSPPVPSLASADVQQYTDGQLKSIIDYGIWPSGMPGSKDMLSNDDIWSIVTFIRHLPKAGSVGEPQMYSQ